MSALIHRRSALVARGFGEVLLIGTLKSASTLRIRAFLTRNGHPFTYLDIDRDARAGDMLAAKTTAQTPSTQRPGSTSSAAAREAVGVPVVR